MSAVTPGRGAWPAAPAYHPYQDLGELANIIVDGAPLKSTVLTLSHWPNNSTPEILKRDTSTEICFAYLDHPEFHLEVPAVSNNHFDEDGLFSMLVVSQPELAIAHRQLLIDASRAGDFGYFSSRDAARLCFAVESCADPAASPLPREVFNACQARRVAPLYRDMLQRLPRFLDDLPAARQLWQQQDSHLEQSLELISAGRVKIDEYPAADLAVVHIPADLKPLTARRYLQPERAPIHPFAIHQHTRCSRLLRMENQRYSLQFRYEGWVQLASRRPALRVSLEDFAAELNEIETAPGTWFGEATTEVSPRLYLDGADASGISPQRFFELCLSYLAAAPVAWDPYDWPPAADQLEFKASA
jgi:hypothetical protein